MKRVFAFLLLSSMLMLSVFIYIIACIIQSIIRIIGKMIDKAVGEIRVNPGE